MVQLHQEQNLLVEPFGLKITETANLLKCSSTTVHRLLVSQDLIAVKRGGSTLVTLASIRDYAANLPRATFGTPRAAKSPATA